MRSSLFHPVRLYHELQWLRKRRHNERVRRTIREEFDPDFYLRSYARARRARIQPIKHYILYGARLGFDPNALFSVRRYLETYPDVRTANIDPFAHFIANGREEGRIGFTSASGGMTVPLPTALRQPPETAGLAAFGGLAPRVIEGLAPAAIDVVVPVYKGLAHTAACLQSVLAARNETPFECLVIDDATPEPELAALLDGLAERGLVRLLRNDENAGFVASVNRGMAAHPERDVVLLNADTLVFDGWIDRIVAAAARDERIASVTPLSNNATICSYPVTAKDNPSILEVSAGELDRMAAIANAGAPLVDLPTGVGFCMWIRRAALDALGDFDEDAFGLGYGEENDFCMRALKAGWRNVLSTDAFVEHYGSVSFGTSQSPRSLAAQKTLAQRHPDYARRVRRHIAADPALPARIRLDAMRLARALQLTPTRDGHPTYASGVLIVTHKWGGGIETYLSRLRAALLAAGRRDLVDASLVMRCHRSGAIGFEPFGECRMPFLPNLPALNLKRHPALLGQVLSILSPALVHVNSFAGLDRAMIEDLATAIHEPGAPVWHVWHDHQPLTPRLTFLDPEHRLVDPDDLEQEALAAMATGEQLEWADPPAWRAIFARYLDSVDRVVAPTAAAADFARRIAPADRIVVEPHPEPDLVKVSPLGRSPRRAGRRRSIAVVGAIGPHKGADVLHGMVEDMEANDLPLRLDIVGYTSVDAIRTGGRVTVHGRYDSEEEAMARLRALRPDLVLLPSIWPETWVFTLSICFALGLPVAVFDLGAQAERVRAYGRGVILPVHLKEDPAEVNRRLLALDLGELWSRPARTAFSERTALAGVALGGAARGGEAAADPSARHDLVA